MNEWLKIFILTYLWFISSLVLFVSPVTNYLCNPMDNSLANKYLTPEMVPLFYWCTLYQLSAAHITNYFCSSQLTATVLTINLAWLVNSRVSIQLLRYLYKPGNLLWSKIFYIKKHYQHIFLLVWYENISCLSYIIYYWLWLKHVCLIAGFQHALSYWCWSLKKYLLCGRSINHVTTDLKIKSW